MVAAGLYRSDKNDTILPPSNVSLFGDVSTVGFYLLGIRGTHIFPQDKYRLDYTLYFYSFPSKFWGMGYDMGNVDANETDMDRWQAQIKASFLFKLTDNLYLGPMVAYDYVHGKRTDLMISGYHNSAAKKDIVRFVLKLHNYDADRNALGYLVCDINLSLIHI